jgi:type VI secretion system protein ImpK
MSPSYSQAIERRPNLALAYEELLTAIVRLRSGRQNVTDENVFRANALASLHSAMQQGTARGYAPDDVNMAGYAVVALLDESILNLGSPVFKSWAGHPFHLELWRENVAGESFFKFLQTLMGRRDSPALADVLEVFYLCILLGYRGRYAGAGRGELSAIARSVQEKILRCRGGTALLSPLAQLPRDLPEPKMPDKWARSLAWAAAGAAVLSVGIFVICKLVLISGSSQLQSLAGR